MLILDYVDDVVSEVNSSCALPYSLVDVFESKVVDKRLIIVLSAVKNDLSVPKPWGAHEFDQMLTEIELLV